ncbi:MAG: hypothetical protein ACRCWG_15780 [Sarcina sp.]
MFGELQDVPLIVLIMLILSIVKIVLFKSKKLENENMKKNFLLKILKKLEEYVVFEIIILFIMKELFSEIFYIDSYRKTIVGILLWGLIIRQGLFFIKITFINIILLIRNGEKKVWWLVHALAIIYSLIHLEQFMPTIVYVGIALTFPYVLVKLGMDIISIICFFFYVTREKYDKKIKIIDLK